MMIDGPVLESRKTEKINKNAELGERHKTRGSMD